MSFWLRVEHSFDARFADELELTKGETVFGIRQEKGWWFGAKGEVKGLFPANHVKLAPLEKEIRREWLRREEMKSVRRTAEVQKDVVRMRERLAASPGAGAASPASGGAVASRALALRSPGAQEAAAESAEPRRAKAPRPEVERMRVRLAEMEQRRRGARAAEGSGERASDTRTLNLERAAERELAEKARLEVEARRLLVHMRSREAKVDLSAGDAWRSFLEHGSSRSPPKASPSSGDGDRSGARVRVNRHGSIMINGEQHAELLGRFK